MSETEKKSGWEKPGDVTPADEKTETAPDNGAEATGAGAAEAPPAPEGPDEEPAATVAAEATESEVEEGEAADPMIRLGELEAEAADLKDQLLRALAEAENVRRRAAREREDTAKYAVAGLARDLLAPVDNLRRALEAVPEGAREAGEALTTLLEGLELTERELLQAFEKHGIKKLEPLGESFDHNYHQAVFEVPDTDQPAGTVVQLLQAGYVLHDRLLRAAMVGVAKAKKDDAEHQPVDTTA